MNTSAPVGGIVVGVDGSLAADRALHWAAQEAQRRRRPLHVVHAQVVAATYAGAGVFSALSAPDVAQLLAGSRSLLADAAATARAIAADVEVTSELAERSPAHALVEASARAQLMVMGARGHGGVASLLLGSVSTQVAMHARCPVVVVKDVEDPDRPRDGVVVGIDGSPHDEQAIGFAFDQASSLGTSLDVVHAWSFGHGPLTGAVAEALAAEYRVEPQRELLVSEALAGWREKYPDVHVHTSVVHGLAVPVLLKQCDGAELLVVSSRGRGGFTGLLLGSVSHVLLQRAGCPVAVVR